MIIVFFYSVTEINNLIIANVNTEDQLQVIKKKEKKRMKRHKKDRKNSQKLPIKTHSNPEKMNR